MDPSQVMNRNFAMWAPPPPLPTASAAAADEKPLLFPLAPGAGNRGWKRKKPPQPTSLAGPAPVGGYQPPSLGELQIQNRAKARRWFKNPSSNNPKHKSNNKYYFPRGGGGAAAPRNTTSFIIRAKRSGGIASLVSPCPVTPAVLPTPRLSPSREGLVDMAKEAWGVDGYGSMKGLIRLRPPSLDPPAAHAQQQMDEEDASSGSSESDVEEHVEVERRLDHDLSRFEMVYPGSHFEDGIEYEEGVGYEDEDPETHVARLEEENLTLKERLFLMEREMVEMRRRLQVIEQKFAAAEIGGRNVVVVEAEEASEYEGRDNVALMDGENDEGELKDVSEEDKKSIGELDKNGGSNASEDVREEKMNQHANNDISEEAKMSLVDNAVDEDCDRMNIVADNAKQNVSEEEKKSRCDAEKQDGVHETEASMQE